MKKIVWVLLGVLILALAACSASAPPLDDESIVIEDEVDESIIDERPSEPATDDYREDSVTHVAATGKPQLIEFFAYWCTTCARVRPVVHQLEAEYWGEIDFVYLDIDNADNRDVMEQYGYTAQPYFVLIDPDGEVIQTWFGYNDADTFRSGLDQAVQLGR